jgi:glycosyltransferase involved in cell wall biosynthesis
MFDRMKIAWLSPFSIKSAIGKYSQLITNELIKHYKVDLWLSEYTNTLPTELKIFHYQPNDNLLQKLKKYDFVICNMGNYLDFHKDIYEVSKKVRSVVILHDFIMHHFFADYYLRQRDTNSYVKEMERLYGANGKKIATDSIKRRCTSIWDTDEVTSYPFFEKAIEKAMGVICHSQFHANKVKEKFLGPVTVMYHPFYLDYSFMLQSEIGKTDLGIAGDKILVVTIGHVNPNKRIDKVIKILGECKELAKKVVYIVIGPHEHERYYAQLRSLVRKYNLKNVVNFLGFQPDKVLYAYMSNADIFVNMRFPAMEGASWSLIEQLYYGKPVVVTDTGFYSELPDDCVMKIRVDREVADLLNALKRLISEDKIRNGVGAKGKKFAIENFSAEKYVQNFMDFLDKVKYWKPVLELIDKVSVELNVMGVTEDMQVIDKAAKEIYKICGDISK